MPGDVGLKEFVEGEVVEERQAEEMLGRALRRNDRNVRVAVLNGFPRQVLHKRTVLHQVLGDGNRFGGRERHYGRHRLEAARTDLFGRVHKVRICETHALVSPPKLHKEVVVLDDLPEFGPGEALAMLSKRRGAIHPGKHCRLPRRGLGKPLNPKTGVNRLGMFLDKALQGRTNLLV